PRPWDWTTAPPPLAALIRQGDGSWITLTAVAGADGYFTIANVPSGPYYLFANIPSLANLGFGLDYIATSARNIDLGIDVSGRPDVTPMALQPTYLKLDFTGLNSWTPRLDGTGDIVESLSYNSGQFLSPAVGSNFGFLSNAAP